jgi:adenylate cyclase
MSPGTEQRKLAAIMFTDMVGYSALSQRNEALALELLAENQRLQREQFPRFNGREVKDTGDGFLVEFPNALHATQCAVEIQRAIAARNGAQPPGRHIQIRIGIHVGDVVHREADMYGDGVNIAARIEPLAVGGGICLSDTVYAQVRNKLDVELTKLDAPELKHIEVPMDVYRVVLPWQPATSTPARPTTMSQPKPGARAVAVGLILALALGALGWWMFQQRAPKQVANPQTNAPSPSLPAATGGADQKSIAVLPFVDMSEKKDQEYFADGLSEELIGMLTTVPELRVPARTSSFYFKGKQTTIADIAKALGVAHVLEGSVRKSGNTLRITAQLIRIDNGYHVWSETYDRKLDDIFQVQDEIASAVVKALKVSLLEGEMPKATRAANPEAYALYLQGRSLHYRGTHADAQKAITYMEQALKLDPTYAPAWFGLADSLVYDYVYFGGSYQDVHARARAAAETALRLDPKLSDAHLAMGRILGELEWDWPAADAEFKRTLELDPNNVLALWCASGYALIGDRLDEALKLIQKAAARDAVGYGVYTGIGDVQIRRGRLAEAEAAYRKATELNATAAGTYMWLGFVLLAREEPAAALAAMEQETDEGYRQYGLALAFGALGRQSDADRALAALETNYADSRPGHIASVYACRKQLDRAFAWLDRAYRQRDGWLPLIKADPCVKNLEPDPRYKALLRKLKLPE